ncbi:hypothetical protein CVT26_004077 [Gymnopilus dilepis]|uniref:Uncharacterized protein n=1 Tax=Gymnopilus dilepis TaxID=231916 RepID=A0A409YMM5_9AGAR|nr:hypothetical protein CVT26_004077 [Gymnopilus dilepis]
MGKLYSNTLLVTFNNRIALRKVSLTSDNHYEAKRSDRLPVRSPNDFGSEVSTFRVTTETFDEKSAGFHSQGAVVSSPPEVKTS